ncbi:MAG: thermonuclease family protein [Gaiellaceae bacterium]
MRDSRPRSAPRARLFAAGRMRYASALFATVALLVAVGCGSSESEEPLIAPSDEEALAEDAQSDTPASGEGESSDPPLEADAVDEVVPDGELATVDFVPDGDTIELDDGRRVRLIQIDTPEGGEGQECYAEASRDTLRSFAEEGSQILLVVDPTLDEEDRFGRLLRYVYADEINVNVELVERGAATVWFVGGDEGIFADDLLAAATVANEAARGLWGACPDTPFDPTRGADTGPP